MLTTWWQRLWSARPADPGSCGEDAAARFLASQGLAILGRNVRSRLGEVDIVAEDAGTLVVVEVKTRSSNRFGEPYQAFDARKQARLRRLAVAEAARRRHSGPVRIDLITVMLKPGGAPEVTWFPNAVEVE